MPHVSRNPLAKRVENQLITNLNTVLTNIKNGEEMISFVEALLTPTEKLMIAKRLAIILLIEEGIPESTIAKMLHVTRITVAKMHLFYEARGKGFNIALDKLKDQKVHEELKKLLFSLARYSARAAGGRVKPGILD